MRTFIILLLIYTNLFAYKDGTIIFTYDDNDPIDVVLKQFFNSDNTHSWIVKDNKAYSITINNIGESGHIEFYDVDYIIEDNTEVSIYEPSITQTQTDCINKYIDSTIYKVEKGLISFDWYYKYDNTDIFCYEFISDPYIECAPDLLQIDRNIRFQNEKVFKLEQFSKLH